MAINEEHEQQMRELQRSYVDFLDDSDRSLKSQLVFGILLMFSFSLYQTRIFTTCLVFPTNIVQGWHLWQVDERYDRAEGKSAGCLNQRSAEFQPRTRKGSSEQIFWGGFSFPASAEGVCWLDRRNFCQGDVRILCWTGGKFWLKACHSKVKIISVKNSSST